MAKYRKRQDLFVDAVMWSGSNFMERTADGTVREPAWTHAAFDFGDLVRTPAKNNPAVTNLIVTTRGSYRLAIPGDFIVWDGEWLSVMSAQDFNKEFEPVPVFEPLKPTDEE